MMNLAVVTSLLIMLSIWIQPVEPRRRCWCDARVNGVVVKNNFGDNGQEVIASCGGWCGCRHDAINRCGLTCDEKVQKWAETVCLQQYKGQQVRSHFKASSCKTGDGRRTYTCNPPPVCYKEITKRVAYTCYKVVNDKVQIPCVTAPLVPSDISNIIIHPVSEGGSNSAPGGGSNSAPGGDYNPAQGFGPNILEDPRNDVDLALGLGE